MPLAPAASLGMTRDTACADRASPSMLRVRVKVDEGKLQGIHRLCSPLLSSRCYHSLSHASASGPAACAVPASLLFAMLHTRALGRAATAAGLGQALRGSVSMACGGPAASSGPLWSEYSRALSRLGFGGRLGNKREEESKADQHQGMHTSELPMAGRMESRADGRSQPVGRGRAATGAAERALTRALIPRCRLGPGAGGAPRGCCA